MRLACSTASFPLENVSRAIARAAWAGFDAVEFAAAVDELAGLEREEELAQRLEADEVDLAAVHAGPLGAGGAEHALDVGGRIGRTALAAHRLGARLLMATAPESGQLEHLAGGLGMLTGVLADVPVRICLANRSGTLVAAPEQMHALQRLLAGAPIGWALDPGEALRAGWDPCGVERLPDAPAYVYLTDAAGGRHVPPGSGEVDWPALAAELRASRFDGYVTLRLQGADPWEVEPAAKEARALAQEWFGLDALSK